MLLFECKSKGVAKAIHNENGLFFKPEEAVTNISKIQSEPSAFPIRSIGTSIASSLKAIYDERGDLNSLTLRCYRLIAKRDTNIAKCNNFASQRHQEMMQHQKLIIQCDSLLFLRRGRGEYVL